MTRRSPSPPPPLLPLPCPAPSLPQWLCVADVSRTDAADARFAWAQLAPWGAFALVSAFELDASEWNVLRFEARISAAEARRVEVRVDVAGVLGDEASADGASNTARRRSRRFLSLTDADPSGINDDDATTPIFPPPPPPPPRTGSSPPPASVAASLADALEDVGETAETEWRRGALILDPSGLVPTSDESAGRDASLRWNRIAWRDVSGAGGELLLRAVAFESRVAAAADGDDAAFSPSDLAPAPPAPLAPSGPPGDPPGDPPASASSTSPSTSAPAKVDASEDASPVAAFAPGRSGESSSAPFLLVAFVVAVSALVAVLLAAYVIERRKRHASRVSKHASVDERGVREGPGSGTRRPHRGKTNRGTAAVSSGRRPPLAPASREESSAGGTRGRRPSPSPPATRKTSCGTESRSRCSFSGSEFGGASRGDEQPGVVELTAEELARALETTRSSGGDSSGGSSDAASPSHRPDHRGAGAFEYREIQDPAAFDAEFQLTETVLGAGASGTVVLARWRRGRVARAAENVNEAAFETREVAVKLLLSEGAVRGDETSAASAVAALRREVDVLRRVRHPRIVRVIAACPTPPRVAVAMQLVRGRSLHALVRGDAAAPTPSVSAEGPERSPLAFARQLAILEDVASAFAYLHAPPAAVAHRDLKPQNVLVDDRTGRAFVCDFGLARFVIAEKTAGDSAARTDPRRTARRLDTLRPHGVGTLNYMAPELLDPGSGADVDERCDAFSFACVAYECFVGDAPWADARPMQIVARVGVERARPPIPPSMSAGGAAERAHAALIEACWAHDPGERPSFRDILRRVRATRRDVVATEEERRARATLDATLDATLESRRRSFEEAEGTVRLSLSDSDDDAEREASAGREGARVGRERA